MNIKRELLQRWFDISEPEERYDTPFEALLSETKEYLSHCTSLDISTERKLLDRWVHISEEDDVWAVDFESLLYETKECSLKQDEEK
jgi:hypothetical protein